MISADDIRLYQDPYTQIPDQPRVGGKKWGAGYVYDTVDANEPNKPAPYRHWSKFPVTDPPTTNECGDLEMHSYPGTYGWALCEDDKVRIGPDIHRELEIQDSEVVKIWQGLLDDLGFLLEDL